MNVVYIWMILFFILGVGTGMVVTSLYDTYEFYQAHENLINLVNSKYTDIPDTMYNVSINLSGVSYD